MRSKKRGSLSLSINAIVVLVLAISMLGLGLGFTKSMFAKFGSKLDVPPPNIPATEEEPIVLPADTVKAKVGKDLTFSVNIYNRGVETATVTIGGSSCADGTTFESFSDVDINAQTFSNVVFKVPAESLGSADTKLCRIEAEFIAGSASWTEQKQITIEVT